MSVHPHSLESYAALDAHTRNGLVMAAYAQSDVPLSDSDVMAILGFTDLNSVRPRITELLKAGKLEECGSKIDPVTHRTVRVSRSVQLTALAKAIAPERALRRKVCDYIRGQESHGATLIDLTRAFPSEKRTQLLDALTACWAYGSIARKHDGDRDGHRAYVITESGSALLDRTQP